MSTMTDETMSDATSITESSLCVDSVLSGDFVVRGLDQHPGFGDPCLATNDKKETPDVIPGSSSTTLVNDEPPKEAKTEKEACGLPLFDSHTGLCHARAASKEPAQAFCHR